MFISTLKYVGSILLLAFLLIATPAWALSATEVAKLLASGGSAGAEFGVSVAMDGNTAVIGAYTDDGAAERSGSAYVFIRDDAGVWTQQAKLLASDGASGNGFGWSVAINGNTALIGAFGADGYTGAVYVFTRDGAGVWTQQAKFSSDRDVLDAFGYSMALDSNTAVIGAPSNGLNHPGAAYIFTRDGAGVWTKQAKLLASDGAMEDFFGVSVAVDGNTALIGAFSDTDKGESSGSAYVFIRDGAGVWTQQAKLLASDGVRGDMFGISIAVAGDTAR